MGHSVNPKIELNKAVANISQAQELLNSALNTVEKDDNKQLLQNTLNSVQKAFTSTQTSSYGCK